MPDVVIVGAGVMGCALASELARRGVAVTVVDSGEVCSGSSGRNAGGVRQQFGSAVNVRLAARTIRRLAGFGEEFGVDLGFHQVGYLFMAVTEAVEAGLRATIAVQRDLGVPTRFIGPAEIAELVPGIRTDDLRGGSFCPTDGYLDPHAMVTAFAADARRRGAVIRQHTRVRGFERAGDRITHVVLGDERMPAGVVVNCAGAWAAQLAGLYGGDLPIQPWRSQVFVITHVPALGQRMPMTIDFEHRKLYFHRDGDALLAGMDNERPAEPAHEVAFDYSRVDELVERLVHRLPDLDDAQVGTGWAGLLELTPDENPIVGWTHCENVYTAAGFSGHGLSIAPALAEEIARELVGLEPTEPLDAYRFERFATRGLAVEAMSMR